jgi:Bacterial TSP3 repeat
VRDMSNDESSTGLFGRAFDLLRTAANRDPDQDGDGLSDARERRLGTDMRNGDTDGDGHNDLYEVERGMNPRVGVPGAGALNDLVDPELAADPDGDSLRTIEERSFGTDPMRSDTDGDGMDDFEETLGELDGTALDASRLSSFNTGLDRMVASANQAVGTDYRRGAEADGRDASPDAFDISEMVEWAAARGGVDLPDGSWRQYEYLHEAGADLSVQEALQTKGALLFHFDSDPLAGNGRPGGASVVMSMGDGTVVHASEAAGEVVRVSADHYDFTHAAAIPGIHPGESPVPADGATDVEVPAEIDEPAWEPSYDDASTDDAMSYAGTDAYADQPVDDLGGF